MHEPNTVLRRRRDRHQHPYFKYTSPRRWMERPRLGPLHAPATVLAIATALVAALAAAGLCSLDRDKKIAFGPHAVLPLLVVELLTLQRPVSGNQHAHADRHRLGVHPLVDALHGGAVRHGIHGQSREQALRPRRA